MRKTCPPGGRRNWVLMTENLALTAWHWLTDRLTRAMIGAMLATQMLTLFFAGLG